MDDVSIIVPLQSHGEAAGTDGYFGRSAMAAKWTLVDRPAVVLAERPLEPASGMLKIGPQYRRPPASGSATVLLTFPHFRHKSRPRSRFAPTGQLAVFKKHRSSYYRLTAGEVVLKPID